MTRDYSMAPFFKTIDTALMGRKTYGAAMKMGGASYGPEIGSTSFRIRCLRANAIG